MKNSIDGQHHEGCEGAAHRGSTVKQRHSPSTLLGREPFGNGFRRRRPVGCGGSSQQESKKTEAARSEEHTSELQSQSNLVCRLLLEKKKKTQNAIIVESARAESV